MRELDCTNGKIWSIINEFKRNMITDLGSVFELHYIFLNKFMNISFGQIYDQINLMKMPLSWYGLKDFILIPYVSSLFYSLHANHLLLSLNINFSKILQDEFQRLQLSSVRNHPLFSNVAGMPQKEFNFVENIGVFMRFES